MLSRIEKLTIASYLAVACIVIPWPGVFIAGLAWYIYIYIPSHFRDWNSQEKQLKIYMSTDGLQIEGSYREVESLRDTCNKVLSSYAVSASNTLLNDEIARSVLGMNKYTVRVLCSHPPDIRCTRCSGEGKLP